LKILKTIVNNQRDIDILNLLSNPTWLSILAYSLESPMLTARTSAVEFFLVLVALEYPRGHSLVMKAFEEYRKAKGDLRLFERLMGTLLELVESRGLFGSVVGSKRDGLDGLIQTENFQKELKDFLVRLIK
jgi:hypothetical protein